jgi:hypothetical protein
MVSSVPGNKSVVMATTVKTGMDIFHSKQDKSNENSKKYTFVSTGQK